MSIADLGNMAAGLDGLNGHLLARMALGGFRVAFFLCLVTLWCFDVILRCMV